MTHRLILFIDELWPNRSSAPWVLVDARNRVIEQGESDPAHWPPSSDTDVVLAGPQCSRLGVQLPRCARRDEYRLLRYALEDQLIRDVGNEHLTVSTRETHETGVVCSVLVIARNRLRLILSQLQAIGRAPSRVFSELELVRNRDHCWTITIGPGGGWILHAGDETILPIEQEGAPQFIEHLLQQPHNGAAAPRSLAVRLAPGVHRDNLEMPVSIAGLEVERGAEYAWWETSGHCTDLLHGEFAPTNSRYGILGNVRTPLLVGSAAFAVFLTATILDVFWKEHQLDTLENRMVRIFETAVPDTPAIEPGLQLQRAVDDARTMHGQLRTDDFLSMLDRFSAVIGPETGSAVHKIEYTDGKLKAILLLSAADTLPLLQVRLFSAGLITEIRPGTTLVMENRR